MFEGYDLRDFDIILIGELHGWDNSLQMESEIIRQTGVSSFFHEMLEDYTVTPREAEKFIKSHSWKSKIFSYSIIKPILKMIKDLNSSGIGLDLPNHGIQDFNDYRLERALNSTEKKEEERLIEKREKQQAFKIARARNSKKIVAITGNYHLRPSSLLIKKLKGLKNSRIILFYPTNNQLDGEPYYGQKDLNWNTLFYDKKILGIN